MLTTAIIAFREFLEAFLITGVFLGISKNLKLKKGREITIAATIGVVFSLGLTSLTYILGDNARGILTEKNADLLENYLMIFSGFFIAYVVFSLHSMMNKARGKKLISAHKILKENRFDVSLFFTIVFLVFREGFEIALFTASVSLFSTFFQNFVGLIMGLASASAIGIATFVAYIRLPIGKIMKGTEYLIMLLGAGLVQSGVTGILEFHFHIELSKILTLPLQFLPDEDTLIGHMLKGFFGVDRNLSIVRIVIMAMYLGLIYLLFKHRNFLSESYKKFISYL